MPRVVADYPIILGEIPEFSRITSPKLIPKPPADIKYVCPWSEVRSWPVQNMHQVRSLHVVYVHTYIPILTSNSCYYSQIFQLILSPKQIQINFLIHIFTHAYR